MWDSRGAAKEPPEPEPAPMRRASTACVRLEKARLCRKEGDDGDVMGMIYPAVGRELKS